MPLDCNGVQVLFEPSSSLARSLLFLGFYYVYIYIYISIIFISHGHDSCLILFDS